MKTMTKHVITDATLKYVTEEVLAVHDMCDRAQIPRYLEGELLSMAQRVSIMENAYQDVTALIGKVRPYINH